MFPFIPIRISPIFRWPVAKAGYRVHQVNIPRIYRSENGYQLNWTQHGEKYESIGHRHGELLVLSDPSGDYEDRHPLEDPALFMNLSKVECREDQVLGFIARHGLLNSDWQCRTVRFGYSSPGPDKADGAGADGTSGDNDDKLIESPETVAERHGESLENWYSTIRSLRFGIALWTASTADSDEAAFQASRTLEKTIEGVNFEGGDPFSPSLVNPFRASDLGIVFTREDARLAAQQFALAKFGGEVIWSFGRALPHNRHVVELMPRNLERGLWLQLVAAIAAESQFKTCEYCGSFYDASATRKTKKYCSDSCKSRAWNRMHPDHVNNARKKKGLTTDGTV